MEETRDEDEFESLELLEDPDMLLFGELVEEKLLTNDGSKRRPSYSQGRRSNSATTGRTPLVRISSTSLPLRHHLYITSTSRYVAPSSHHLLRRRLIRALIIKLQVS